MSHHQFSGWDSFKHCPLVRWSNNIFWSSLQVWSEGHCLNLAKVISPIIWFQQLGKKASVTFGSSDDQRTYSGHVTNFRFFATVTIFRLLLSLSVGQTGGSRGSQAHLHPVRNWIQQIWMFVIYDKHPDLLDSVAYLFELFIKNRRASTVKPQMNLWLCRWFLTKSSQSRATLFIAPGMRVRIYKGFWRYMESMPFAGKRLDFGFPYCCLISEILQHAWIPIVVLYLIRYLDHWRHNCPAEQIGPEIL